MAPDIFVMQPEHSALETELLNVFCCVVRQGNFSRAAAELATSQPVVTRKISRLEECVGMPLFVRSNRGCTLTPAGEILFRRAPSILMQLAEIKDEIANLTNDVCGSLAMGITHAASTVMAPRLLPVIAKRWPKLRLEIVEALSQGLAERVCRGELDFAVLFDPPPHPDLICTPLLIERLCLVGHPDSAINDMARPTVRDLVDLPLVLPSERHAIRTLLEDAFQEIGAQLNPVYEASSMTMLREMAAQGLGYTLLTQGGVEHDVASGKLQAKLFEDRGMIITLTLVTKRDTAHLRNIRILSEFVASEIRDAARCGQWPGAPTVV
jgi:LysR family nitrogen assimilation transcriptional regulator